MLATRLLQNPLKSIQPPLTPWTNSDPPGEETEKTHRYASLVVCLPIMTKSQQIIFYWIISGQRKSTIKINGSQQIHFSRSLTTRDSPHYNCPSHRSSVVHWRCHWTLKRRSEDDHHYQNNYIRRCRFLWRYEIKSPLQNSQLIQSESQWSTINLLFRPQNSYWHSPPPLLHLRQSRKPFNSAPFGTCNNSEIYANYMCVALKTKGYYLLFDGDDCDDEEVTRTHFSIAAQHSFFSDSSLLWCE